MKHNFYMIQDQMRLNTNVKKIWITPELEVLDGRETYSGQEGIDIEDEWWEPLMGDARS